MKKINQLLFIAAAALTAACSNNNDPEGPKYTDNEIRLKTDVTQLGGSNTRAAFGGTGAVDDNVLSVDNPLIARVLASKDSDYSNMYGDGTMTFTAETEVAYNKPMIDGAFTYPGDNASVYLTGLYPADNWDVTYSEAATAVFTIDGTQDIMLAPRKEDGNDGSFAYQTLQFAHQLTWIKIKFTGDESAVTNKEITVNSIKLIKVAGEGVKPVMTVDLNAETQTVTHSASETASENILNVWDATEDVAYPKEEAVVALSPTTASDITDDEKCPVNAYVMAPHVVTSSTEGAYEYTFEVTYTEKNGDDSTVTSTQVVNIDLKNGGSSIDGDDLKGKFIGLHLKFNGSQIMASAAVDAWGDGGNYSEEI